MLEAKFELNGLTKKILITDVYLMQLMASNHFQVGVLMHV